MSEALSTGIRLIAIDLDHTLLTSDLTLSPADRSAMEHVASTGVQIALATGRMPRGALRYADLLPGLVQYIISYNGAITLDARRHAPIHAVPLDLASVWPVVEFALGQGYHLVFFSGDKVCTTVADGDDAVLRHYVRRTGATITSIALVEPLIGVEIHPAVESPTEQAVHDALVELGIPGLNILKTRLGYVECTGMRASKLQALSVILARNGWSADHLMAIGEAITMWR